MGEVIEVHRDPNGHRYRHAERLVRGARLAPEAFPDVVLLVDDILG